MTKTCFHIYKRSSPILRRSGSLRTDPKFQLDFGDISTSDFPKVGVSTPQNLFSNQNTFESLVNPELMATVYALGRVNMILTDRNRGTVKIVNDEATDYDWNVGGGNRRNTFIRINNTIFGIIGVR